MHRAQNSSTPISHNPNISKQTIMKFQEARLYAVAINQRYSRRDPQT